jgi:hypothetical protein
MKTQILKTLILYSFIGLFLAGVVYLFIPGDFGYSFFLIILSFGQICGLILFLLESDIYKTSFFKFIIIGLIIYLFGVVFKISHWPYSRFLFLVGLVIILVCYFLRFFYKKIKVFLDYIKMIWLLFFSVGTYFSINHWPYGDMIGFISSGIFWIGLFYILYDYKLRFLFNKK